MTSLSKLHNGAVTLKRMTIVTFTLFLLLASLTFASFVMLKSENEEVTFIINMNVTYCNKGIENWTFTEEDRTISLFMNNTWQTIQLLEYSYTRENTTFDEDGNPIAVLQFPESQLYLGENISYRVTYHALSKPRLLPNIGKENSGTLDNIPKELKESYCGEGGTWLVNDPELQDLAQNIVGNETRVLTLVKNFVEWIRQNVDYPAQKQEGPLYPNETYARLEGDCDDQAILLITLCRIYEIPAYLQIGCIYDPSSFDNSTYWNDHLRSISKQIGWHGWAMVYVPPWGWLPVDLTYVLGGFADPLDAIKKAAVTSRNVLQYMNVNQTDYVASSRSYRDFLEDNHFYVYTEDEMLKASPTNHEDFTLEWLFSLILFITIIVVVTVTVEIFLTIRRKKKRKETRSQLDSRFGL